MSSPAFVQGNKGTANSGNVVVAFPSPTTLGNHVYVVVSQWQGPTVSVNDSQGNSYAKIFDNTNPTPGWETTVWQAQDVNGAADTVTVTNTSGNTCQVAIMEYSGIANNPVIETAVATGNNVTTLGTGNITTTHPSMLLTICADGTSLGTEAAAGYTTRVNENSQRPTAIVADANQPIAGTVSATWTGLQPADDSLVAILGIQAAAENIVVTGVTPTGFLSTPYVGSATASGGTPPYTYAVTSGALPNGLSLNASTGAITGIPMNTGFFPFTVTATDSITQTGSQPLSITVLLTEGFASTPEVPYHGDSTGTVKPVQVGNNPGA